MKSSSESEKISREVLDAVQRARRIVSRSAEFFAVITQSPEHVEAALGYALLYQIGDQMSDGARAALSEVLARDVACDMAPGGQFRFPR